jgi:hypothetical protein
MTVLTITINDQVFDKKSAEVQWLARVLLRAASDIQKKQGTVTSGTMNGVSATGTPNTSLGSWTYTPSASNP